MASAELASAGIRHSLAGALAVACYGFTRTASGVDFVVGDEGFIDLGRGMVGLHERVPIAVKGVPVKVRRASHPSEVAGLSHSARADGIPVLVPEALVCLKLRAHRARDQRDIVELLLSGLDEGQIRAYVQDVDPGLLPLFETMVRRADRERRGEL